MSYLDLPRFTFGGSFYTDPCSINNDPTHYDPACVDPSPWQEPEGRNWFRFVSCFVAGVLDGNGAAANGDPLFNSNVSSLDAPVPAKLVDLDPYMQAMSTIYGLQLTIALPGAPPLIGTMDPASLNTFWGNAVIPERGWGDGDAYGWGSPGGDSFYAGVMQTVLRVPAVNWPAAGYSPVLDELKAATATDGDQNIVLSFRFVVDSYINNPLAPVLADGKAYDASVLYRRYGRVSGAIGPWQSTEPRHTPGTRWLNARPALPTQPWNCPTFNPGPFKVDFNRKTLTVDLANSICRESIRGPLVDVGTLAATVTQPGPVSVVLGTLAYQGTYNTASGIVGMNLNDEQLGLIARNALVLTADGPNVGAPTVLFEDPSGFHVAADSRVVRLASDLDGPPEESQAVVLVHATQWGLSPVPQVRLSAFVESVHGTTPGATAAPSNPGDGPEADGALFATITETDSLGFAILGLMAQQDCGGRLGLDSQLYFVFPYVEGQTPWLTGVQESMVAVLMWSAYPANPTPSWSDVQTLLAPYDKLFPYMRSQVRLTDLNSFTSAMSIPPWSTLPEPNGSIFGIDAGILPWLMTRGLGTGTEPFPTAHGIADPRYMPVSRDLSPNRIRTILAYVRNNQALAAGQSGPTSVPLPHPAPRE